MGLMDKVKAQATVLAQKTQETAREGKARLDQATASRHSDTMLRNLGALVYAEQTGRAAPDSADQIARLISQLRAFNGEYIRAMSAAEFEQACMPWVTAPAAPWPADRFDPAVFTALAALAQTRVSLLADITAMVDFAFLAAPDIDEASWAKAMKEPTAEQLLADVIAAYETVPWQPDDLRVKLTEIGAGYGLSLSKAQVPVRVAVMGRTVGLPLFESLEVLGREQALHRLEAARERLIGLA